MSAAASSASAERGSAVVEFALVVPLLILVLALAAEAVVVGRTQLELVHAARDGARVAATTPDPAAAVAAVREGVAPELSGVLTVSVERPHVVGRPAIVEVSAPHTVPVLGWTIVLSARSAMRVE